MLSQIFVAGTLSGLFIQLLMQLAIDEDRRVQEPDEGFRDKSEEAWK